jgi:uncharacterized protein (TIGR03435 family)
MQDVFRGRRIAKQRAGICHQLAAVPFVQLACIVRHPLESHSYDTRALEFCLDDRQLDLCQYASPVKHAARSVFGATLLSIAAASLAGQSPAQRPREAFEVASVKPNSATDVPEAVQLLPGGGVRMTGMRLRTLIRVVYSSTAIQRTEQIVGGPAWSTSERFDILAKANGELTPDAEGRRPQRLIEMLKTLLEDRFAVRVHTEMRRLPVFALRVARDGRLGPQVKVSTAECARPQAGAKPDPDRWCGFRSVASGGNVTARHVTMAEVAAYFAGYTIVGRPIADLTGLTDRYDFHLEFVNAFIEGPNPDAAPVANPNADNGPGLFTALTEQLGLTLQPESATIPVLVIDRAELPTPD